jgi:hypothetical protein
MIIIVVTQFTTAIKKVNNVNQPTTTGADENDTANTRVRPFGCNSHYYPSEQIKQQNETIINRGRHIHNQLAKCAKGSNVATRPTKNANHAVFFIP